MTAHNPEAEAIVVGSFLRWPDLLVDHDLRPEECHDHRHRHVLRAMRTLPPRPVTPVGVGECLLAEGTLNEVGGMAYLLELHDMVSTPVGIEHHVSIVRQHAQRRGLAQLGADLAAWGQEVDTEPVEVVSRVERRLLAITQSETPVGHDMPELVEAVMEDIQRRAQGIAPGKKTGLAVLDEIGQGLRGEELTILAARPGMGKTALALAIAKGIAQGYGEQVAVFSLEMGAQSLVSRMVAAEAEVDLRAIRGMPPAHEARRITQAMAVLRDLPIRTFDQPRQTIDTIASMCRRLASKGPLGLVVIDHAGLVSGKGELRERMVATSHGAKAIAKECKVPVILLAQLNRDCEKRNDKRPLLADLKESGSLEEDADAVWFVYRDEYYNKDSDDKGVAEVIVAKQREGPTDTVRLAFLSQWTKFGNLGRSF